MTTTPAVEAAKRKTGAGAEVTCATESETSEDDGSGNDAEVTCGTESETSEDDGAGNDAEILSGDTPHAGGDNDSAPARRRRRRKSRAKSDSSGAIGQRVRHVLAFFILPAVALILALGVGYLKWHDGQADGAQTGRIEGVEAAREIAVAMLTYQPDTAEKNLDAASDRMTGGFRDEYLKLIRDVVIPGAREQKITALATVPAAGSVSADARRAVVLIFINQTTTVGDDPPTNIASSVKVTLDKVDGRWLVSAFEPI